MNNDNRNRATHARRRPEQVKNSVTKSSGSVRKPADGARTQAVVRADAEKKLAKREKKRARAQELALAEANWQEDIVRVRGGIDGAMLTIILVLVAFGSIAVFSASYPEAVRKTGDGMTYIRSQIGYVLLGLAAMTVVVKVPIGFWRRWAPIAAYALAAVLLIAALFIGPPKGLPNGGSTSGRSIYSLRKS
ncbi:MAG: FtsW/RodA/SpoVE family cell cycle protein [Clostridia bacterium]|nr:FtsW/RodA/SpoVE family cell cycle protein [Clostridia bacterium]